MSIRPLLVLVVLALTLPATAEPWRWQESSVPEVGFDLDSAAVVRVTSLAGSGKGTLRAALLTKGPRLIVFEVGGVIDLEMEGLDSREPQVFVAGQTAPAPGITLIRGGMQIAGDRTVVQHLRVRPGDAGQAKGSGWEPDGITTTGGPAEVWIDHCSVTWSCDENISAATYKSPTGEPARRIFIRDCLIAEGLSNASHAKGEHSKGTLVFDGTQQVAIVRNLYASHTERNPIFKLNTSGVVVNNVIANPGQRALHAHVPEDASGVKARLAAVGNVVLFGERTKKSAAIFEGIAEAFFKDNEGYNWRGEALPLLRVPFPTLAEPPLWPEGLKAVTPAAALWHVARFAGARPAERDAIDTRIVTGALTGQAKIIDSQDEVGGYPKFEPASRPLVVPDKGRRQWLERLTEEVVFGQKAVRVRRSANNLVTGAWIAGTPAYILDMSNENLLSRITVDPELCHGKPCVRGLRYPVETLLEYLAGGDSPEDLLAEFPDLEREDILACYEFSRRILTAKSVHLALK